MSNPAPTATAADLEPYRTLTRAAGVRMGLIPSYVTVEALHAALPQDGSLGFVWTWFTHGRYSVENLRATPDGIDVVCQDRPGRPHLRVVMVYPLGKGRTVRMLRNPDARPVAR